jgi:hypothetical protein
MTSLSAAEPRGALATWAPVLAGAHLLIVLGTGHARAEHVIVDLALLAIALVGPRTRRFLALAVPLWLTGVLYADIQPLLLPLRGTIHTGNLFAIDASWFPGPGGMPWPAYFADNHHAFLDFVTGAAYLLYLLQFFGIALWLYFSEPGSGRAMAWCFFGVNLLGITIYLLYPAAPPWYVLLHGHGPADLAAAPSAAGAARFDELVGISYFSAFYARNANVFGAMPSLHVAYPTIAACFLWTRGTALRSFGVLFASLISFSAIYLVHHYVLDVVVGVVVGLATYFVIRRIAAIQPAG